MKKTTLRYILIGVLIGTLSTVCGTKIYEDYLKKKPIIKSEDSRPDTTIVIHRMENLPPISIDTGATNDRVASTVYNEYQNELKKILVADEKIATNEKENQTRFNYKKANKNSVHQNSGNGGLDIAKYFNGTYNTNRTSNYDIRWANNANIPNKGIHVPTQFDAPMEKGVWYDSYGNRFYERSNRQTSNLNSSRSPGSSSNITVNSSSINVNNNVVITDNMLKAGGIIIQNGYVWYR